MKKSFPVNIGGRIYYFDEDAYERLNVYYTNLKRTFDGDDGDEIVGDIETRVTELISDRHCSDGEPVVTIAEIDDIIGRMGKPEEIAPSDVEEPTRSANSVPPPFEMHGSPAGAGENREEPIRKRLYRDMNDKVIAGVAGGIAEYTGLNPTGVRAAFVILALCTTLWPVVILYVVLWLLIPAAETPRQILEMTGQRVTVDSVGRTTLSGSTSREEKKKDGFWHSAARFLGVVIMSFVGIVGLVIGLAMIVLLALTVGGIISYLGWNNYQLVPDVYHPVMSLLATLVIVLAWLIPCVGAVWASCCVLFKAKGVSRKTAITLAVIEFALIVAGIVLTLNSTNVGFHHISFPRFY